MVSPRPVDPEQAARHAFAMVAVRFQHTDRSLIIRLNRRFDPVKRQRIKGKSRERPDGPACMTTILVGLRRPVTEPRGLRRAAFHMGQIDRPDQRVRIHTDDVERIGAITGHELLEARKTLTVAGPR